MTKQLKAKGNDLPKYLNLAINKMCEVIDVDPESIDYDDPNWFHSHKWDMAQEDEFKNWLLKLMRTNKEARAEMMSSSRTDNRSLDKFWQEFNLMWGWMATDICPAE